MELIEELFVPDDLVFDRDTQDAVPEFPGLVREHPVTAPGVEDVTRFLRAWGGQNVSAVPENAVARSGSDQETTAT